jgi:hypothetical protein
VMHHWFKCVLFQRLKIKVTYLHDNLKGYEVDDAMLDGMLVGKQIAANS